MQLNGVRLGHRFADEPWLFRHFDFELQQGEKVGLLGPSGCGKTTLARILAGYLQPLEGAVQIVQSLQQVNPSSRVNPIQMVFQHPEKAVNPRWRVKHILHESWEPDPDFLKSFHVQPSWLQRRANELSIGQLQRICIVRALHPQTRFLIADEMTANVDAITQATIWHTMLNIAASRNLGMLIISHDDKLIQRLCDRVIYLY